MQSISNWPLQITVSTQLHAVKVSRHNCRSVPSLTPVRDRYDIALSYVEHLG